MLNLDHNPIISQLAANPGSEIVITTHHKPDADALGSSLALARFLQKMGHHPQVITPTDYPDFLFWMPGNSKVIIYEGNEGVCNPIISKAKFIFCLDFNQLSRINEMGEVVKQSSGLKVLMDHHRDPSGFEDIRYWDIAACSTCELVFKLIEDSCNTSLMDKEIADCLFTGLMTDTGGFRHNNTNKETFRIASRLLDFGADNSKIFEHIYDNFTENRTRMIGYCLSEKLEIIPECRTALITLNAEELKRFDVKTGDTEGLVNFGLGIKDIVLAVLIIDRTKLVKMSFRSKGSFSCNEFAAKYFNGGGHFNASGGQSTETLDETVERFKSTIKQYSQELLQV